MRPWVAWGACLCLFAALPALAQNTDDPRGWALEISRKLLDNPDAGVEALKGLPRWNGNTVALEQVRSIFTKIQGDSSFGTPVDVSHVGTRAFGERLRRYYVAFNYRNGVMLGWFSMSRTEAGGWEVRNLGFEANMEKMPWPQARWIE